MTYSPFERLLERNGLTWGALLVGLQRGWVTPDGVARAVAHWLETHPEEDFLPILLLSGCASNKPDEIVTWLKEANGARENESSERALDRWRWAILTDIAESNELDNEAKTERLQECYGEFGFPEDMWDCCIYNFRPGVSLDAKKPCLEAMRDVISRLERSAFA